MATPNHRKHKHQPQTAGTPVIAAPAASPAPPPSSSSTTSKFAWSTYQTAPLPSEVPKPSSRMLENARHAALLDPEPWEPKKQAAESLRKMLSIGL
ncbi:hypothetical protein BASA81_000147 [Batrachochytrium salamandrivorans]|nr:hypothetical protein BASA81_000147 [Batrachochytrium salamandrivorans]